jgi:hypothetical protein
LEARRERLLALEVFFLGTAMVISPLILRGGAPTGPLVQLGSARRAKPAAALLAQRRLGQTEQYRVAHQRLQVELVAAEPVGLEVIGVFLVQLAHLGLELASDRFQAAPALTDPGRPDRSGGHHPSVDRLQEHLDRQFGVIRDVGPGYHQSRQDAPALLPARAGFGQGGDIDQEGRTRLQLMS